MATSDGRTCCKSLGISPLQNGLTSNEWPDPKDKKKRRKKKHEKKEEEDKVICI